MKPAEMESLKEARVHSLYWQVAECDWANGGWRLNRIAAPMSGAADLEIIPVFRIKPEPGFLGAPESADLLAKLVREWSGKTPAPTGIQLDFDCPDRLLPDYARFLRAFGKAISPAKVSITALADWPKHPQFNTLANSVSSLAPMFYDLESDKAEDVRKSQFHPMAEISSVAKIKLWADCPRPWLAGLPNFDRLSIYEADGKLSGHLRGWEHDPVFFDPALKPRPLGTGTTVYEVETAVDFDGTRVSPGEKLVHRAPDALVLKELTEAAKTAGADGVVYFALPGPGIQAAFSPEHLGHLMDSTRSTAAVEIGEKGSVILKNPGPADLPARTCDPEQPASRGWQLELKSDHAGAFRSASPGGFAEVEIPGGVPAEFSRTMVLHFSKLPAGKSIVSGSLIKDRTGLTWQIRSVTDNHLVNPNNSAR